jgi:hypothetical protein
MGKPGMGTYPGWNQVGWKIKDWEMDRVSNGHRIYWPDKCSLTVERSINFTNDEAIFLSNLIVVPIQGENDLENQENQQNNLKIKTLETEKHQDNEIDFVTDNTIDFVTDKQNQQHQVSSSQTTDEPRSHRTRMPTRYIKDIQSGIGTTDGRSGKSNLPPVLRLRTMYLS